MLCVHIVSGPGGWLFAFATHAFAWHGHDGPQSASDLHGSSLLTGAGSPHWRWPAAPSAPGPPSGFDVAGGAAAPGGAGCGAASFGATAGALQATSTTRGAEEASRSQGTMRIQ
jgi:hypothetical protein